MQVDKCGDWKNLSECELSAWAPDMSDAVQRTLAAISLGCVPTLMEGLSLYEMLMFRNPVTTYEHKAMKIRDETVAFLYLDKFRVRPSRDQLTPQMCLLKSKTYVCEVVCVIVLEPAEGSSFERTEREFVLGTMPAMVGINFARLARQEGEFRSFDEMLECLNPETFSQMLSSRRPGGYFVCNGHVETMPHQTILRPNDITVTRRTQQEISAEYRIYHEPGTLFMGSVKVFAKSTGDSNFGIIYVSADVIKRILGTTSSEFGTIDEEDNEEEEEDDGCSVGSSMSVTSSVFREHMGSKKITTVGIELFAFFRLLGVEDRLYPIMLVLRAFPHRDVYQLLHETLQNDITKCDRFKGYGTCDGIRRIYADCMPETVKTTDEEKAKDNVTFLIDKLDQDFLPHLGRTQVSRTMKVVHLCVMVTRLLAGMLFPEQGIDLRDCMYSHRYLTASAFMLQHFDAICQSVNVTGTLVAKFQDAFDGLTPSKLSTDLIQGVIDSFIESERREQNSAKSSTSSICGYFEKAMTEPLNYRDNGRVLCRYRANVHNEVYQLTYNVLRDASGKVITNKNTLSRMYHGSRRPERQFDQTSERVTSLMKLLFGIFKLRKKTSGSISIPTEMRAIAGDRSGFVDVVNSPHAEQLGIVEQLALSAFVTVCLEHRFLLHEWKFRMNQQDVDDPLSQFCTPIQLPDKARHRLMNLVLALQNVDLTPENLEPIPEHLRDDVDRECLETYVHVVVNFDYKTSFRVECDDDPAEMVRLAILVRLYGEDCVEEAMNAGVGDELWRELCKRRPRDRTCALRIDKITQPYPMLLVFVECEVADFLKYDLRLENPLPLSDSLAADQPYVYIHIFFNSVIVGVLPHVCGSGLFDACEAICRRLREYRRLQWLPESCSVSMSKVLPYVSVNTEPGRVVRPIMTTYMRGEKPRLHLQDSFDIWWQPGLEYARIVCRETGDDLLSLHQSDERPFILRDLINRGCVTYIDPVEQSFLRLAETPLHLVAEDVDTSELSSLSLLVDQQLARNPRTDLQSFSYDGMVLAPYLVLGLITLLMNSVHNTMAAKQVYGSNFINQICALFSSHYNLTPGAHTDNAYLMYPDRKLFSTVASVGYGGHGGSDCSIGNNIVFAFSTFGYWNPNDGTVFSRGSVSRGLLKLLVMKVVDIDEYAFPMNNFPNGILLSDTQTYTFDFSALRSAFSGGTAVQRQVTTAYANHLWHRGDEIEFSTDDLAVFHQVPKLYTTRFCLSNELPGWMAEMKGRVTDVDAQGRVTITFPKPVVPYRVCKRYDHLDPVWGLPRRRQVLFKGDALVLRVKKDSAGTVIDVSEPLSEKHIIGDFAIVERVIVMRTSPETMRVRIILAFPRDARPGDKIGLLQCQKDTICEVIPDHKMPYEESTGLIPNILFNPFGVITRVTMGLFHELQYGTLAVRLGHPIDSTAMTLVSPYEALLKRIKDLEASNLRETKFRTLFRALAFDEAWVETMVLRLFGNAGLRSHEESVYDSIWFVVESATSTIEEMTIQSQNDFVEVYRALVEVRQQILAMDGPPVYAEFLDEVFRRHEADYDPEVSTRMLAYRNAPWIPIQVLRDRVSSLYDGLVRDRSSHFSHNEIRREIKRVIFQWIDEIMFLDIRRMIDQSGEAPFIDGQTLKRVPNICVGIMSIERLIHIVDKGYFATMDDTKIDPVTRQPARGRGNQGGHKLGVVEYNMLVSCGTSLVIKRIMQRNSDLTEQLVCRDCGGFDMKATEEDPELRCRECNSREIRTVLISYALMHISRQWEIMGFKFRVFTRDSEEDHANALARAEMYSKANNITLDSVRACARSIVSHQMRTTGTQHIDVEAMERTNNATLQAALLAEEDETAWKRHLSAHFAVAPVVDDDDVLTRLARSHQPPPLLPPLVFPPPSLPPPPPPPLTNPFSSSLMRNIWNQMRESQQSIITPEAVDAIDHLVDQAPRGIFFLCFHILSTRFAVCKKKVLLLLLLLMLL